MTDWTCPLCGLTFRGLTTRHFPIRCECGTIKPSESEPHIYARSRGLGDRIAKALKKVGIRPCRGCNKRRKRLNRLFPYPQH